MIIEEANNYRIESDERGVTLVVTGSWTNQVARVLADGHVDGLDLNYAKGFKDTDLEFLRDWPLRRLYVLARTVRSLSPVSRLSCTLEELSIQTASSAAIDLGNLPCLTALAAEWSQIGPSVSEAPGLLDLMVRAYDEVDLGPLRWNTSLTRLRFKDRPRIRCLSGVELLRSLEHLAIYLAPLDDIDALRSDDFALRELHVESCPLRDLSPLANQRRLTFLNASDCGDLASVGPLRGLNELSVLWLFGTTKILDGDLSPLADLPRLQELRMRSRRTYRPSVEDVQSLCTARIG